MSNGLCEHKTRFNVPQKLFSHSILVHICSSAALLKADNSIIQFPYPERSGKLEFCHPFFWLIFLSFVQFGNHLWLECVTGYPAEVIVFSVYWVNESLYRISGGLWCSDLFQCPRCLRRFWLEIIFDPRSLSVGFRLVFYVDRDFGFWKGFFIESPFLILKVFRWILLKKYYGTNSHAPTLSIFF